MKKVATVKTKRDFKKLSKVDVVNVLLLEFTALQVSRMTDDQKFSIYKEIANEIADNRYEN